MMKGNQHMLACFYLILLYVLLLSSDGSSVVRAKKPRGFVAKLFHHDSVHSPFYNPNETIADRAKRATRSSLARFAYLMAGSETSSSNDTSFKTNYYGSPLKWLDSGKAFYANISVGQPPVVQFVILDSGSSLLWVQCEPCTKCFNQVGPFFNPCRSSTYSRVPFNSEYCVTDLQPQSTPKGDCIYNVNYLDESQSHGFLAKDTLTFNSYEDDPAVPVTVPDLVIGCGTVNNANIGPSSGVLGVGAGKTSLVSQFGYNFSFCMGSLLDPTQADSTIIFGDGARMEGSSTPLQIYQNKYYLEIEYITVGEKQLDIDPAVFKLTATGDGGTILDSASTISHFPQAAFDALADEVNLALEEQFPRIIDFEDPNARCYSGFIYLVSEDFPTVTLHLSGGVELQFGRYSIFRQTDPSKFCMAITTKFGNKAIIGAYALQTYNIGIDTAQLMVYFWGNGC